MRFGLLLILCLGLAIRLLLIGNPGFEADVAFWKSWSLAASEHGIVWMAANTNNNYPPGFGYVLWMMGKTYALIGNPQDFNNYWNAANFGFLLVAKLIPILSDIGIAVGIYWLLWQPKLLGISAYRDKGDKGDKREKGEKKLAMLPLLGSALYFLHPVVILDGAWWGQVDSFGVLFLLFSLILLFLNKPALSIFTITLGFLLKLQNIIYIPILLLFIWRRFGIESIKKSWLASFLAFIIGTLPFLVNKEMERAVYLLTANADWFPWLSLHAYNIWWILSGGDGMGFSDKFLIWGALSPKIIGLILFLGAYLISLLVVFLKPQPKVLLTSLFFTVFSFFMLLTQSHERYIFPAFLFLPLFLPFALNEDKGKIGYWVIGLLAFWLILSATATLDIHRTLLINYPHNGLPLLSAFKGVNLTIFASWINVGLYLTTLIYTWLMGSAWILPTACLITLSGMIFANWDYLSLGKVSLTKLKMTGWYQEYGGPQVNLTVDSQAGPKSWNRLSSVYFFYPKGIGSHAKSELVYQLRGKFRRLSSDYGIDTEAGTQASVVFQVMGDQKVLFTSEKVERFDLPRHMDIDITGVDELKLVILPTDDGNRDDHADWLNPVLYR